MRHDTTLSATCMCWNCFSIPLMYVPLIPLRPVPAGGINPHVNLSVVTVRPPPPPSPLPPAPLEEIYDHLGPIIPLPHISPDGASTCPHPAPPAPLVVPPFTPATMRSIYNQREDNYIARVGWWPDGAIMVQTTNRTQNCLQLLHIQPSPPFACRVLLTERVEGGWINLHDLLHCLTLGWAPPAAAAAAEDFMFLWGSERSGYMQLYLYKYDSAMGVAVLQSGDCGGGCIGGGGEWVVDDICDVDQKRELVYFTGSLKNMTEKHLYVSRLCPSGGKGPSQCLRLTHQQGWHSVTVHTDQLLCVDVHSSVHSPPAMHIFPLPPAPFDTDMSPTHIPVPPCEHIAILTNTLSSDTCAPPAVYASMRSLRLLPLLTPPSFHLLDAPHIPGGLSCCVYRPDPAVYGEGPFPCVVSCYGGPHVQRVTDTWVRLCGWCV